MPAYSYTAINKVGTKKKGIISAISEREARKLVKDLNLTPLKISESKNLGKTLRIKNKDIDIIYIALPHSLHYEWILKCMEGNKKILVENSTSICSFKIF